MTTSTVPQESDDDLRATYAGAKRRIAALEQQLEDLQNADNKRKSVITSNISYGRIIPRLVSLFQTTEELVEESDRRHAVNFGRETGPNRVLDSIDEGRTFRGYQLLIQHVPSLEEKLTSLDIQELGICMRDMRKGASGARGDDAANLKPAVVSWLNDLLETTATPPLSPTDKSQRGFEHELTGQLLCPIEFDWSDDSVRQNIRDGHPDFEITADSWPAFVFPVVAGDRGPLTNHDGIFRSAILVKAFKFLFTSPSSAEDVRCEDDINAQIFRTKKRRRARKAPTRGHIANILAMRAVTPRSIAYVAVQLRFALSNATSWSEDDGCFNYPVFYNNIVDFFELPPGPAGEQEVNSLLSWWTLKVFGKHRISSQRHPSATGTSVSKLATQRAARE